MKPDKKNQGIKAMKGDVRIGNFILRIEESHIKVMDIGGRVSHRFSRGIVKGQLFEMAMRRHGADKETDPWLSSYAAVMFNVLCSVPDMQFLEDLNRAAVECANRHKDLYGIKEDISAQDDAAILREEKELHEAAEEIKAAAEKEDRNV